MPEGYDEPVNLEGDFEEIVQALLAVDPNATAVLDAEDDDDTNGE